MGVALTGGEGEHLLGLNLIESHIHGSLNINTGQEVQNSGYVNPHGSTDDFTGDRHNMGGQAIQLNKHMIEKGTK